MKRTPLKRKTRLRTQTPLKRSQKPLRATKKRKTTKAAALRRKRGEWSTKTADNYFSGYIRGRDKKCLRCFTTENLTCSHYHRRGHSATRYDPKNCITICVYCHAQWEGPKNEYTAFMLSWLGQDEFIALSLRAGLTVKRSDMVAEFKKFYEGLDTPERSVV